MKLRAITLNSEVLDFDISDAPVNINDKLSILLRRPGSPIFYTKSIARGDDTGTIYETDFVIDKDNRFKGFVVYKDAFYMYNFREKKLTPIENMDDFTYMTNNARYKLEELSEVRSVINFAYDNHMYKLNRIMYADDRELYVDLKSTRKPVITSEVKLCTGLGLPGMEFYFGQYLADGQIVLHNLKPMVRMYNGVYREIKEGGDYEQLGNL